MVLTTGHRCVMHQWKQQRKQDTMVFLWKTCGRLNQTVTKDASTCDLEELM